MTEEGSEDVSEYNGDNCGSEDDESGEEVECFEEHDSPSVSEDSESKQEDAAPNRGQGRGGRGGGRGDRGGGRGGRGAATGGRGRVRGARGARQPRGQQLVKQAALEAKWLSFVLSCIQSCLLNKDVKKCIGKK